MLTYEAETDPLSVVPGGWADLDIRQQGEQLLTRYTYADGCFFLVLLKKGHHVPDHVVGRPRGFRDPLWETAVRSWDVPAVRMGRAG